MAACFTSSAATDWKYSAVTGHWYIITTRFDYWEDWTSYNWNTTGYLAYMDNNAEINEMVKLFNSTTDRNGNGVFYVSNWNYSLLWFTVDSLNRAKSATLRTQGRYPRYAIGESDVYPFGY